MAIIVQDGAAADIDYRAGSVIIRRAVNSLPAASFTFVTTAAGALPLVLGDDVKILDGATTLFGGIVEEYNETDLTTAGTTYRSVQYRCTGFSAIAKHRIVVKSYTNQSVAAIVSDIVDTILSEENVTTGTIEDLVPVEELDGTDFQFMSGVAWTMIGTSPLLARIVFNYDRVDQALDELAEISGYSWWIDADKALQFQSRRSATVALSFTDASQNYTSISIKRHRQGYRNTQWVRAGDDKTELITETFAGDGEAISFPVGYPVYEIESVEVDTAGGGYVAKTFGIIGVETGKDWYYRKDADVITQDAGGTVLAAADTLRVIYRGSIPIIAKVTDSDEITARAAIESGSGKYEAVAVESKIDTTEAAFEKGNALLRRYGETLVDVKLKTTATGFSEGDLITIDLTDHALDDTFLVSQIKSADRGDGEFIHDVVAVSNEFDGGWIAYFKTLESGAKQFVLRDNEVLMVLRSPDDKIHISDSMAVVVT